jgi:hypothetical protein
MNNLQVGDKVTFAIDGKFIQDTIKYIDCDVIEGERFDLTFLELEKVKEDDWQLAGIKAKECIEEATRKAEELFLRKSLENPEIYKPLYKDIFILFYIEGYTTGFIKNM